MPTLLALQSAAGTFELNSVKGLWQFNGSLAPYWGCQSAVSPLGFTIDGVPGPRFVAFGGAGWLDLRSDVAPYGGLATGEKLRVPHAAEANGPPNAARVNSWTIAMDVRIPSKEGAIALLQSSLAADASEIFLNDSRRIVFVGAFGPAGENPVASDPIPADTWVRLAFSSAYSSHAGSERNTLRAYVDGIETAQSAGGDLAAVPEGRYGLAQAFSLFSDALGGSTAPIEIGSLAFWGLALSDADIAAIGATGPAGISWPEITVQAGWPPLPPLNGKLMFGTFETHFTPDMESLAATARPSGEPDAIAEVTIDLGDDGGSIPGMPDHTFGQSVNAYVLPDGTAVSLEVAWVNHSPADEPDLAESMDVTYQRVRVKLSPEAGATSTIRVLLPAGLGVNAYAGSALLHDQAAVPDVTLDQALAPVAEVEITGTMLGFGFDGMIYPVLDRVPVRFSTHHLYWDPPAGTFRFNQTWDPAPFYTRSPQLAIARVQRDWGLPGAALIPPSNDGYFSAAGVPLNAPIVVMARPEGAALVKELTVSLATHPFGESYTGFATHYPIMSVRWEGTDSQIHFVDDAIDSPSSHLYGAGTSLTSYRRAPLVTSELCSGQSTNVPDENIFFLPGEGLWSFTPDGGLKAYGAVGSTPEIVDLNPFTPQWGGFLDESSAVRFAHRIVADNVSGMGGFPTASVLSGGTALRNDDAEAAALPEGQRVAALLLTGFGSPADEGLVERPGTKGFYQGLADYPGVNLRVSEGAEPHRAKSIIAGVTVAPAEGYELDCEAKYCIRPGGVNGRHIAAAGSGKITFEAYGTDFELTRLILSYRDGLNVDSGVSGGLFVRDPADFTLIFQRLLFGPKGELTSAEVAPAQAPTLGPFAWKMKFTPLTLDFPQPTGVCPPPQPGEGFVRIGASARLPGVGDGEFTGSLGFMDGNLVTESLPENKGEPVATGTGPVSRFEAGSLLQIAGTAETGHQPWNINPVTGISLNRWDNDNADGTLTVGGLMDVPFFVDMPVILSTGSKNTPATDPRPELFVRKPWAPLDDQVYDPGHLGFPEVESLKSYRISELHDPVAARDWQDLVSFSLPVKMDAVGRVIRSRAPVQGQTLMLFNLTETVRSMTPDNAELTLDGRPATVLGELAKQVNVASLLNDSALPGLEEPLQGAVDGALTCVRRLDELLADHSHPLLDAGLVTVVTQQVTAAFFESLSQAPDKSASLDTLVDDASALIFQMLANDNPDNPAVGQWRRDIRQPVTDALAGMNAAAGLTGSGDSVLALAAALAHKMGLPAPAPEVEPDEARREAVVALMSQTVSRLQSLEAALEPGGQLTIALKVALGAVDVALIVQRAVDDLKPKWAPGDPAKAAALYKAAGAKEALRQELAAALADRFAGSAFAGACGTLLRQYASDPQTLARQALDDTLRMACALVANTAQPGESLHANGSLYNYLLADDLCGYARICGDSLHELRLDAKLTLQAHELMPKQKFDGWCLLRDVDSGTPGADNISEGDITAEILAGATTQLEWGTQNVEMTLGAKIGLNAAGDPVSFMGDMALEGSIGLCAITVNTLKLGVGIGPDDAYFYGRTAGRMGDMKVAVGAFFGKTDDIEILKIADRDIGSVLSAMSLAMPVTGVLAYGEGDMSLMPLLSIPPSCVLDLRVGGGQGFCALLDDKNNVIGGFKIAESVTGEVLCICNVTGRFGSVLMGAGKFNLDDLLHPELDSKYLYTLKSISGRAWTTLEGEVGYDPFSYSFEKTLGLTLEISSPEGDITWDVDY